MCNCKKAKQVETVVITGTPEPVKLPEDINEQNQIEDGRLNAEAE